MLKPSLSPALCLRGITKQFGSNTALDSVDFSLERGEIHAVLGENGAGKSTLMNIMRGLLRPDRGALELNGSSIAFSGPADARHHGIGMVHQHFLLVPSFTIAENLVLASASGIHSLARVSKPIVDRAEEIAGRLGWALPMDRRIADLPVGTQQRVEIVRALIGDAKILLFDEPTAVLAPTETEELFRVLRALRDEGRSLVFVSHKLREVMDLCDRVTVLRRGKLVGTLLISETNPGDLAERMVGKDAAIADSHMPDLAANPIAPGESVAQPLSTKPLLVVDKVTTRAGGGSIALNRISFAVAPGEILGFAGVDGNGQNELAQALTGLRPWRDGTLSIGGTTVERLRPQDLARYGIAYIPPDRQQEGLALDLPVSENLVLEAANLKQFTRGPFLKPRALREFANQIAGEFDVRAGGSLQSPARSLSGGNQQKVVIARALWRNPAILVAVSPTRGLDVAAMAYVHGKLRERRARGGAIILISTELDEVIALADRIAVLYEGRIVGIVPPNTPREKLGLLMGGTEALPDA